MARPCCSQLLRAAICSVRANACSRELAPAILSCRQRRQAGVWSAPAVLIPIHAASCFRGANFWWLDAKSSIFALIVPSGVLAPGTKWLDLPPESLRTAHSGKFQRAEDSASSNRQESARQEQESAPAVMEGAEFRIRSQNCNRIHWWLQNHTDTIPVSSSDPTHRGSSRGAPRRTRRRDRLKG